MQFAFPAPVGRQQLTEPTFSETELIVLSINRFQMIQIGRRTDLDHDDMLWVGIRQVKGECGSWTLRSPCREAAQFNQSLQETLAKRSRP